DTRLGRLPRLIEPPLDRARTQLARLRLGRGRVERPPHLPPLLLPSRPEEPRDRRISAVRRVEAPRCCQWSIALRFTSRAYHPPRTSSADPSEYVRPHP